MVNDGSHTTVGLAGEFRQVIGQTLGLGIALAKLKRQVERATERERQARQSLKAATSKTRKGGSDGAVTKARERHGEALAEKERAISMCRETSILLRDQRKLAKALERKEVEKQKAIAAFQSKWEREYDKKLVVLRKNVAVRKKLIQDAG